MELVEKNPPKELTLNELKAQAYDIFAEQQHYQARIQQLNKVLTEINQKIAEQNKIVD